MVEKKRKVDLTNFKVTCFLDEEANILFPMLLPLRFHWTSQNSVVWENETTRFEIVPFTRNGREKKGYRIHFKGSPEAFQYLFNQSIARFNPIITAIEWTHVSEKSQSHLVGIAEQNNYRRCTQYGLYEKENVSIVLLPTNEIHLQYRERKIYSSQVSNLMEKLEKTAAVFMESPMNLFSLFEGENLQWQ